MKLNSKIASSLSLIAMAALSLGQPAYSADWRSIVDSLSNGGYNNNDGYNNGGYSNNDYNNSYRHNNLTVAQIQSLQNIEASSERIRAQIDSSLASGQLAPDQAANFRAQLRGINDLRRRAEDDGSLNFNEARQLIDQLTVLQNNVNASTSAGVAFHHGYNGGGFGGYHDGYNNGFSTLESQRTRVMSRLMRNRNSGRLTPSEYMSLRAQMDDVSARLERMRSRNGGGLNEWQRSSIASKLTEIDARISESVAGRENTDSYGYSGYNYHQRMY